MQEIVVNFSGTDERVIIRRLGCKFLIESGSSTDKRAVLLRIWMQ